MTNYKIKGFDVLSVFKFGVVLGSTIAIGAAVLLFFFTVINSIISAIGPKIFINVLIDGVIKYFFYLIFLAFYAILVSAIFSLGAFMYNYTVEWTGGIKLKLEEYEEKEESDQGEAIELE